MEAGHSTERNADAQMFHYFTKYFQLTKGSLCLLVPGGPEKLEPTTLSLTPKTTE